MAEPENKQGEEEQVETHDPHYDPIISLPLMTTASGEEEEHILLKYRAKLLRLDKSSGQAEWKERGVGEIKVLQHKQTGKTRILMRREKTLKICANHFFHPQMKLQTNTGSDKSWIWGAQDFADEEVKSEIFCVKFTNVPAAQHFKEVFEKCCRGEHVDPLPDEPAPSQAPAEEKKEEKKEAAPAATPAAPAAPAPEQKAQ